MENNEIVLYLWYKVSTALNKHLASLKTLPSWAVKKNIASSLEELQQVYHDRLDFEFTTIKKMGFCSYFLIVADEISWCRKNGVAIGPGRGSAAGCLCAYLLGITKIDPIRYLLLFERFLNPDRISMPDIDVDHSQLYRYKAKEYLASKYGDDRVASIGTFNRMGTRQAVQDIVRSLNLAGNTSESFRLANEITKTLGEDSNEAISFSEAMENEKFRGYVEKYPILKHYAERYEDVLRQMSMHAAGVLISSSPFEEELPMMVDKKGMVLTALDGTTVEKQGYLKLDTLGLKNLDVIESCKENIKKIRGVLPSGMSLTGIDIIPGENPFERHKRIISDTLESRRKASKTYELLRQGKTLGIFQCEMSATQDLLRRAEVNAIEDIADIIALIRPGPRQAGGTEAYVRRKRGEEVTAYQYELELNLPSVAEDALAALDNPTVEQQIALLEDLLIQHPTFGPKICSMMAHLENPEQTHFNLECIKTVCDSTQGIPLFQEQLMQIAVRCASFTKGESDRLRKGVGKKDADIIREIQQKFIDGIVKGGPDNIGGLPKRTAEYLWYKFILPYGSYGFNLSHSIAYSFISYETAYLKANYPGEFYAALLSHEDNQIKINAIIAEAKASGIKFRTPNINQSTEKFEIIDELTIVYALTSMKGVGEKAAAKIVERRPFTNMVDFIGRSECNALTTKTLIKGGGFDHAFIAEQVTRKNYFDFFEDARDKLKRQTDRFLRKALLKEFNLAAPKYTAEEKVSAQADGTYITPAKWFDYVLETNEAFNKRWYEAVALEVAEFQYDWLSPITVNSKGETRLVERESGDPRPDWTIDEIFEFEEEIYGTTLSGHRLDPYSEAEQNFIQNVTNRHVLSDSLDNYRGGQEVYVFVQILEMSSKSPYAKDKKQFTRRFRIEDRSGKDQFSTFENVFTLASKKEEERQKTKGALSALSILDRKLGFRPVVIAKCRVNDWNNRRSLQLVDIVEWINRDEILQKIQKAKDDELGEPYGTVTEIDNQPTVNS